MLPVRTHAVFTLFLAFAWAGTPSGSSWRQVPSSSPPADLGEIFRPGVVFQDRNGDDIVDFVNARLMLGLEPSDAEVSAAANVTARLGFEAAAMNLPVGSGVPDDAAPLIVIGHAGLRRAVGSDRVESEAVQPGNGDVTAFRANGAPGVAIAGADAAGTMAAASLFAGRLPHLWGTDGPTVTDVAADVRTLLEGQRVGVESAVASSALVKSGVEGIERLVVTANLKSRQDLQRARAALQTLAHARRARRAGRSASLSYDRVASLRVRLINGSESAAVDLPRDQPVASRGPQGRRPGSSAKENLDLSNLFGIDGLLGDSDNNLIADRVDAIISAAGPGAAATVDLSARIGLESTGVSIPIAIPPDAVGEPETEPTLVLVGSAHPLVLKLVELGRLTLPTLAPGRGAIRVVRKAFGDKSALVIAGSDPAGLARAVRQVAERFPHLWARGKDRTTVGDVVDGVRRLLTARTPAGQAATALYKLAQLARELEGKNLEQASVKLFVQGVAEGFPEFARREVASLIRATTLEVNVQDLDVRKGRPIVDERVDIPSEVDEFWRLLRTRVIPAIRRGRSVSLSARLSEPPEVRAKLEAEARAALLQAGGDERMVSVSVLSAYKQGYSWLYDVVRPALLGKPVSRITIRFAEIGPPPEWRYQGIYAPTRWLLEVYPIDDVLARELGIDLGRIRFEKTPIGSPAYEVVATGPGGERVFHGTFEPRVILRPFFDRFPGYEQVRVTTGWLTASVASTTVVDQRIATDVERFWDHFQGRTLPALYDHVMTVSEGKPRADDAPFFGELRVELTLSEPDYRIGIDEEQISSLEAVHEELYFNTLHFFDVFGRFARGPALAYPGRVIPIMRPKADGKAGSARIMVTAFDAPRPSVVIDYKESGASPARLKIDVPKVALDRPIALGAVVREGHDGLDVLELRVKVDTERDERRALIERASEERVDRQIMSAEQVRGALERLDRLKALGLYSDALTFDDLQTLRIVAAWEHDPDPSAELVCEVGRLGSSAELPDIRRLLAAGFEFRGERLVQWTTPMPPREANEVLARMSFFPEATVYRAGQSYLGQDIWAMDLMPPQRATHWSQFKATTLKPTIVYSARQHANEVSSTSHILRLAELILTDESFRNKLRKVNVVIHPITNPDGVELAYELYKITPHFMLHAGYLGSLGVDVTVGQWEPDPVYPETKVRPDLWRTWLPDVFLNPHGYPSHEWVQLFSEYAAWVRNRVVETRDYWSMRGWWMPGFSYLDDPKYPRHRSEQFKLRQAITTRINDSQAVRALNQRAYERYRRYTFAWDQRNFKLDFTDGVLMYSAIKGARASPTATEFMIRQPNVTIWEGSTEAPDETARGDWLELVAGAGLTWDIAILDHVVNGSHEVERKADEFFGGVSLSLNRPRPPKDKKPDHPAKSQPQLGAR